MHSQASDDDELATFSFVNGQAVEYSTSRQPSRESAAHSNTTPARWVKPGESITIQNVVINHGHFYFGGRLKTHSSGNMAIFITMVPTLLWLMTLYPLSLVHATIMMNRWDIGPPLPHSPGCRGAYLDWLASDRSDASCPVGYVFIYFYGLERRVLADGTRIHF
jgi:hypothetical protein